MTYGTSYAGENGFTSKAATAANSMTAVLQNAVLAQDKDG